MNIFLSLGRALIVSGLILAVFSATGTKVDPVSLLFFVGWGDMIVSAIMAARRVSGMNLPTVARNRQFRV